MNSNRDWKLDIINEFPSLFRGSLDGQRIDFSTGVGWKEIIRTICLFVDIERDRYETQVGENHEREWPEVIQIKEKYGTLRMYVVGTSDVQHAYVSFGESISSNICEVCGSVGHLRGGNWIKTLCDEHHALRTKEKTISP